MLARQVEGGAATAADPAAESGQGEGGADATADPVAASAPAESGQEEGGATATADHGTATAAVADSEVCTGECGETCGRFPLRRREGSHARRRGHCCC